MLNFLSWLSGIGAIYAIGKIIYDIIKGNSFKSIVYSHEFIILCVASILVTSCFIKWVNLSKCDFWLSVLVIDIILIVLVFLCVNFWDKNETLKEKRMSVAIAIIAAILILFVWFYLVENTNCAIPNKILAPKITTASAKKDTSKANLPTPKLVKTPKVKHSIPIYKLPITERQKEKIDTIKKTQVTAPAQVNGKNVITGGTFSAPVHNGDTYESEIVYHPTDNLINQIADSTSNKSTPIYIKYESSQAIKNRTFSLELMKKLTSAGYKNVSVMDPSNTYNWGISERTVIINKIGNNLTLFVNQY